MATTTYSAPFAVPQRSFRSMVMLFAKEAKYEVLKNTRIPIYAISTIVFPLMFYVLFGIVLTPDNPVNRSESATYLLATMGTFGVMGASMFGFAVSLAMERGQGWLQVKRASPMPLPAYFTAKLCSSMLFSLAISLAMLSIGVVFAHVRLAPLQVVELVAMLVGATIPFSAHGPGAGLFRQTEFRPGDGEPGVLADVVLHRTVDSDLHAAACPAEGGASASAVPHEPTGPERHRYVSRDRFDRRDTCRH